jgi:hypothetical protein
MGGNSVSLFPKFQFSTAGAAKVAKVAKPEPDENETLATLATLAGDRATEKTTPAPSGFYSKPAAATVVTCGPCRHFERDTINPEQGRGACSIGEIPTYPWPHAKRQCTAYASIEGSLFHEEITTP